MPKRRYNVKISMTVFGTPVTKQKPRYMMKKPLLYLVRSAVVAALYFVLTIVLAPISFGVVQFRLSEALVLLPFIYPETALGLVVGCALANITSPFGLIDIIVGAVVTGIAGYLTSRIKNIWLAPLPPILLNAIILPITWAIVGVEGLYIINVLSLLASQSVVIYILGIPLVKAVKRLDPTKRNV